MITGINVDIEFLETDVQVEYWRDELPGLPKDEICEGCYVVTHYADSEDGEPCHTVTLNPLQYVISVADIQIRGFCRKTKGFEPVDFVGVHKLATITETALDFNSREKIISKIKCGGTDFVRAKTRVYGE